jgi:sporulation protein YlmC with PRC-barrel domain
MAESRVVTIFYNDTDERVSKVVGKLISSDHHSFVIKMGDKIITVPWGKIVRIEQDDE